MIKTNINVIIIMTGVDLCLPIKNNGKSKGTQYLSYMYANTRRKGTQSQVVTLYMCLMVTGFPSYCTHCFTLFRYEAMEKIIPKFCIKIC